MPILSEQLAAAIQEAERLYEETLVCVNAGADPDQVRDQFQAFVKAYLQSVRLRVQRAKLYHDQENSIVIARQIVVSYQHELRQRQRVLKVYYRNVRSTIYKQRQSSAEPTD